MFDHKTGREASFSPQATASTVASYENDAYPQTAGRGEKLTRFYPWAIFGVVLLHILYLVFLNTRPDIRSTNGGRVIDDSFILLGELVILAACFYALRRIQHMGHDAARQGLIKRAQWAIFFLTASALCNTVGQVLWIWYDGTLPAVPYPALDDALFLLNYPFFFIGIALLIPRGGSAAGRARVLVDAGTLVLSVVAIFWYFVLGPTMATLSGTVLEKSVSLAYPISDLAGAIAAIILYLNPFNSATPRRTLTRLTLGIACSAISNMVYGYIQASGAYYTGMFVDAGFPLTWMLIAWAVLTYPLDLKRMLIEQPEQITSRPQMSGKVSAITRAVTPLLFTALTCALLVLVVALRGNAPIVQVVLVCGGLFLLPIVRQSLTLVDNTMLNERLRVALSQSQSAFHQSQDKLISTTLRAEHLEHLLGSIENLRMVLASLARGDFSVRAPVDGPLAPVAQSLNLLIERINRWAQTDQINKALMQEADGLYRILERLAEDKTVPNIPTPRNTLPTGNALLSVRRLQTRLAMRAQKQRETVQFASKRLQAMQNALVRAQGDIQNGAFDHLKAEQFLTELQRHLGVYEAQLQELSKQANVYEQTPNPLSSPRMTSGKLGG